MSRAKKLQPVLKIAELNQQDRARSLFQTSVKINKSEERLKLIEEYCDEYSNKETPQDKAHWLQNHAAFLDQLTKAVDLERQSISEMNGVLEDQKRELLLSSNRSEALQSLAGTYRDAELREKRKKLERTLDDMTGHSRNRHDNRR
jgi:flagellar protein FliJ